MGLSNLGEQWPSSRKIHHFGSRVLSEIGNFRPKLGLNRPNLGPQPTFNHYCPEIDRCWPRIVIVSIWADLDQRWADITNFDQCGPMLTYFQFWPDFGQHAPKIDQTWPEFYQFGQIWREFEHGWEGVPNRSGEILRFRAEVGRHFLNVAPNRANVGRFRAEFWPISTTDLPISARS